MPKTKGDKQLEAEERQQDYELRSVEEQLAELDKRPGESRRERAKLLQLKSEMDGVTVK